MLKNCYKDIHLCGQILFHPSLFLPFKAAVWLLASQFPLPGINKENFAYYKHAVERLKDIICLMRPVIVYTQ